MDDDDELVEYMSDDRGQRGPMTRDDRRGRDMVCDGGV